MVLKTESRHRLQQSLNEAVFKNLLIADSGKGHVEEMVRMLRDLPGFRAARINLLHVVPEQGSAGSEEHWGAAASLLAQAVARMGLDASEVNSNAMRAMVPSRGNTNRYFATIGEFRSSQW